jgi:predicted peptidase
MWTRFLVRSALILTSIAMAVQAGLPTRYGQTAQQSERRLTRTVKTKYLVYAPAGYERQPKKLPVILYLHGGSLRGNDVDALRTIGLPHRLERDRTFPFIVVAPLCPEGEIWTDADAVIAVLDDLLAKYPADATRVYITGHSMGGRGALYIAYKFPDRFAAIVAMSAYAPINEWAARLSKIPIWYMHGVKDNIAPIGDGDALVKALKAAGGNVRYSRLDDRDHFVLDLYDHSDWSDWLLEHSR